jgi:hypothetical protein
MLEKLEPSSEPQLEGLSNSIKHLVSTEKRRILEARIRLMVLGENEASRKKNSLGGMEDSI